MDTAMDLGQEMQAEVSDPLDWSVEQVVAALCDQNSPWLQANANTVFPDMHALSNRLQENFVNGVALLLSVDENVLRYDLGLKALGHRALINQAIRAIRSRSLKLQDQEAGISHGTPLVSPYSGRSDAAGPKSLPSSRPLGSLPSDQPAQLTGTHVLGHNLTSRQMGSVPFVAVPPSKVAYSVLHATEPSGQQRTSRLLDSTPRGECGVVPPEFDRLKFSRGLESQTFFPEYRGQIPPTPTLNWLLSTPPQTVSKSHFPTINANDEDSSNASPMQERGVVHGELIKMNGTTVYTEPAFGVQDSVDHQTVTPVPETHPMDKAIVNKKERISLAPALIQQVPPNGSGFAPLPQFDVAKKVLINGKERKRLAPTLMTKISRENKDSASTSASNSVSEDLKKNLFGAEDRKQPATSVNSKGPLNDLVSGNNTQDGRSLEDGDQLNLRRIAITRNTKRLKHFKDRKIKATQGYLGSDKFSVDDIFFGNTSIGQVLDSDSEGDGTLIIKPASQKFRGRRLYVHKVMKHYLFRPARVSFLRNGVTCHALQPYSAKILEMLPARRKRSFLSFYPLADRMLARREDMAKWPVLSTDGTLVTEISTDERLASDPLDQSEDDNENHEWDYLLKWKHAGSDIIPAKLGESGSEGEYDTDTWLEIEEEQESLDQAMVKVPKRVLPLEEVHKAIDEGIEELVSKWKQTKLPKRELGAFNIWTKSRREGNKRFLIREAQQRIDQINEKRLIKMRNEIATEIWTKPAQIRKQCKIMEQSIFDCEDLVWKISLLERKVEPERPPPRPRKAKAITAKTPGSSDDDEDAEVLGSDSDIYQYDDHMDSFVVDDPIDGSIHCVLHTSEGVVENTNSSNSDKEETFSIPRKRQKLSPRGYPLHQGYIDTSHDSDHHIHDIPMPAVAAAADSSTLLIAAASISPLSGKLGSSPATGSLSRGLSPRASKRASGGFIDLTRSDPLDLHQDVDDGNPFLDRTAPFNPAQAMRNALESRKRHTVPAGVEVIDLSDTDSGRSVDFDVVHCRPIATYIHAHDRYRLVAWIVYYMDEDYRESLARRVLSTNKDQLRKQMVNGATKLLEKQNNSKLHPVPSEQHLEFMRLARLFVCWQKCTQINDHEDPSIESLETATHSRKPFHLFRRFLRKCLRHYVPDVFKGISTKEGTDQGDLSLSPASRQKLKERKGDRSNAAADDSDSLSIDDTKTPRGGRFKRKRPVLENLKARNIRESDRQRLKEQEERAAQLNKRLLLQRGLASGKDQPPIVVNNSKFDDQAFVYLNEHIGRRIKSHQVEGLQFIWREIVTDFTSLQGCLLAHTMGLGKTMQVISFLVTVAETSRSQKEEVVKLIPEHLRVSRTLILCPPSLIDNWVDEFLIWAPRPTENNIGQLRKVDSSIPTPGQRLAEIHFWFEEGGVLLLSYERFRDYISNKATQSKPPPLSPEEHARVKMELLDGPNIIVADEAHKMRNPTSGIANAAALFKSKSRIALTGSPLANNLEEYHSMINWVAPGYLGPLVEFRAKYVEPIQEGLYFDSSKNERRRAGKMLRVLKQDLAPKIHRADITVLKGSLPQKYEFVIKVPLTDIQKAAYKLYISKISRGSDDMGNTRLWDWLAVLSLLCNHPRCYKDKLQDRAQTECGTKALQQDSVAIASSDEDQLEDVVVGTQAPVDEIVVPGDAPVTKMGLTPSTIQELLDVFDPLTSDLDSINNSNKTKIFVEILNASKKAGDKVLVFTHSIPTLDYLEKVLKDTGRRYSRLDGRTKMTDRQKATKAFNTNQIDIYLVSTRAGGLGLNLYGANRVIIFDFNFNPTWEEQAVGRAYRIGQTKPVYVYRFICAGTFEDLIHNKAVFKLQLAVRVVDKKNPAAYATKKAREYLFAPKDVEREPVSQFIGQDPKVLDKILAKHKDDDCITSIEPTETFERDEGEILTAEDEKEADQLLEDERLKRKDPVAYAQLLTQRQLEATQAVVKRAAAATGTPVSVPQRSLEDQPKATSSSANDPVKPAAPSKQTPIPPPPRPTADCSEAETNMPMAMERAKASVANLPSTLTVADSNGTDNPSVTEKKALSPGTSPTEPAQIPIKKEKSPSDRKKSNSKKASSRAASVSGTTRSKTTTRKSAKSPPAGAKKMSRASFAPNMASSSPSNATSSSSGTEDGELTPSNPFTSGETIDLTGDD